MKSSKLVLVASLLVSIGLQVMAGGEDADRLVARADFEVSEVWKLRPVGGRDYFPMFNCEYELQKRPKGGSTDCALLKEAGVLMSARGKVLKGVSSCRPAAAYGQRIERTPEADRVKTPYTLEDAMGRERYAFFSEPSEKDTPFFIQFSNDRPAYLLDTEYPLADRESYRSFREAHPNFLGVFTLGEFDQQLIGYSLEMPKSEDKELVREIWERVPWPETAARPWGSVNRGWPYQRLLHEWWPNWARDAYARAKAFHFGEERIWSLNSGTVTLSLAMAEIGCNGVAYEATSQGAGDWLLSAAATRGASRQFDIPFGWYTANFYTGYRRDGKKMSGENSTIGTNRLYSAFGPDRGASPSLLRRQNNLGWLAGAAFQDTENWYWYYFDPENRQPNGARALSEFGRDFDVFYRNAKKLDRGVPYTPLAVLVPVFDQYGASMFLRDHAMDPWLATTVVLTLENRRFGNADENRREGVEGCLYNSPYGAIYDMLAPDASRSRDRMGEVLASYKAAIVAGKFKVEKRKSGRGEEHGDAGVDPELFRNYVKGGGTLIVSEEKIAEGIVDAEMCGVAFGKEKARFGRRLIEARSGREVSALTQEYQVFIPSGAVKAKPYYIDENGGVIAYVNDFGRGRVVTIACERMLPEVLRKCQHHEYRDRHAEIIDGKLPLELMSALMARVSADTMPFQVEGDVMWGVNARMKNEECIMNNRGGSSSRSGNQKLGQSDNYLVWIFNNRGVTKFIGEKQVCDPAATAKVVIRRGEKTVTIEVPAGEVRLVGNGIKGVVDPNRE